MSSTATAYEWLSGKLRQARMDPSEAKARLALRRECKSWLASPNVTGFGVGEKWVCGNRTGLRALQVFVARKQATSRLDFPVIPSVVRLPNSLELVLTDVVELGAGRPHGDPRRSGDGIRRPSSFARTGSIGCFVRSTNPASAKLYALTCWHIASEGSASGAIVEWCDDNLGLPPNVRLGKLDRSVRPDKPSANGVVRDVALIQLDQGFELSNRNRAGIAIKGVRTTAIAIGETVHAYGFGGQAAKLAIVTNPQASMKLTYPGLGDIMFRDAVLCGPCSQPRDSGSIAVDDHGRAIGMVVGGEVKTGKKAGWTLLVPMQALMDHFALKLYEDSGPGAQPLPSNVVGQMLPVAGDLKSAVDTLARTVWGEAEGEPPAGKIAVTNVIVNRVRAGKPNRFGATVEAVCTRNNGAVWQFSCWTAGSTRAAKCREITTQNAAFRECLDVARRAILGVLDDLTNGSDHYHATSVSPSWVSGRAPVLVVGRHLFYNSIP